MTQHYSVIVERESNGTFSAWVAGLPGVYAAADTAGVAKRAIRSALAAHLAVLQEAGGQTAPQAELFVLRCDVAGGVHSRPQVRYVGLGALLGRGRTAKKAAASRRNGALGGRPRILKEKHT